MIEGVLFEVGQGGIHTVGALHDEAQYIGSASVLGRGSVQQIGSQPFFKVAKGCGCLIGCIPQPLRSGTCLPGKQIDTAAEKGSCSHAFPYGSLGPCSRSGPQNRSSIPQVGWDTSQPLHGVLYALVQWRKGAEKERQHTE